MAATKRAVNKKTEEEAPKTEKKTTASRDIRIPLPALDPKLYSPILVVLLIIASFLLGTLFTKVQYLQSGKSAGNAVDANTPPTAQPQGQAAAPSGPPAKVANLSTGDFPVKGDTKAKVKVVEFADLRCPFCEQFFTNTESQIIKDYVDTGKVQFSWRDYAFLGPASTTAGEAAYCANKQNKFWDFHDYMYKNQPPETDTSMYSADKLTQIATDLGMDGTQFSTCLTSPEAAKQVADDLAAGQKAGVNGTPTTFVNGTPIVGAVPYDQIKKAIDSELAKAK